MRRLWLALAMVVAAIGAPPGSAFAGDEHQEPTVRRAIESVIDLDTGRANALRLPRVSLDTTSGDLTVIFAMRRPLTDDPAQIVASATDDVFSILWAAYASDTVPRITTVTVLGTYAVVGRFSRPREVPLVRAVLSVDGAARLDWTRAATLDPASAFDVWWVYGELARSAED